MRILVITSCTGVKSIQHPMALTFEDFRQGSDHLALREQELADYARAAEHLYAGQQHLRLMRGVNYLRQRQTTLNIVLDLWILSAGYGLIPASKRVAPYECTFQGMPQTTLLEWAEQIEVPQKIRQLLGQPYDLSVLLLGDAYLRATKLDEITESGGPLIAFCGGQAAKRLKVIPDLRAVPLTNEEARRFSCGLVALKGELTARLLCKLGDSPQSVQLLLQPQFDLLEWLEACGEPQ